MESTVALAQHFFVRLFESEDRRPHVERAPRDPPRCFCHSARPHRIRKEPLDGLCQRVGVARRDEMPRLNLSNDLRKSRKRECDHGDAGGYRLERPGKAMVGREVADAVAKRFPPAVGQKPTQTLLTTREREIRQADGGQRWSRSSKCARLSWRGFGMLVA
ncbi:hypothetical protein N9166_01425 [bacterium]|nr:hypothetical protein [bacterium]